MAQSIEPKIAELANGWLKSYNLVSSFITLWLLNFINKSDSSITFR